ncbi:hypothetical protein Hdeb2414_s0017g00511991 [Helianthus debilis subsp. tardiflorus]
MQTFNHRRDLITILDNQTDTSPLTIVYPATFNRFSPYITLTITTTTTITTGHLITHMHQNRYIHK